MENSNPLASHLPAIARLCQRYGIARLELFGSAASGMFEAGRSDFDFLYELDLNVAGSPLQRFVEFSNALANELGAPIDLINPRYIRNKYFAAEVEQSRMPIYG